MSWNIPGTTLAVPRSDAEKVDLQFQSMFLGGGLTLGQVATITGLENHVIQNWVKRGFLPPPVAKRYSMEQLCRIVTINMLKGTLPLERISSLLSYINGSLTDESDDIIDDTVLYFMFVRLVARARSMEKQGQWDEEIRNVTKDYVEPVPGARDRIEKVLKVMLTAWVAARMRQEAENMLKEI